MKEELLMLVQYLNSLLEEDIMVDLIVILYPLGYNGYLTLRKYNNPDEDKRK